MAVIDVGSAAINRAGSSYSNATNIDYNNPANDTGILDTVELYVNTTSVENVLVGTFVNTSSVYFTNVDYVNLGVINSQYKSTFTGLSIDVNSGNYIGYYGISLDKATSGGGGVYYNTNSNFDGGSDVYTIQSGDMLSLYATGATVSAGSLPLKNVFGRPFSGVFR